MIKKFTVSVDGESISGEGTEPIEKALKILFPDTDYKSHHSSLAKDYVLGAKEKCRLISIQFTNKPFPPEKAVKHALNRANLNIAYHSFYEEKFCFSTSEND